MRYYGLQNETKAYLNRLQKETSVAILPASVKILNDRVESLKKSGIWKTYGLGFNDTDGDAYLSRANVTDLIGRAEVLWFVRGMKALGLYSNMVAWPMRSYQNAGTGSTVYSLGGLGVYNGTMINSLPWGQEGCVSDALGKYITHLGGRDFGTQPFTGIFVGRFGSSGTVAARYYAGTYPATATEGCYDFGNPVGARTQFDCQLRNIGGVPTSRVTVESGSPLDTFHTCITTRNDQTLSVYSNSIFKASNSGLPSGVSLNNVTNLGYLMARQSAVSLVSYNLLTMPFASYVKGVALNQNQITLANNLYKSTLGNALGLT